MISSSLPSTAGGQATPSDPLPADLPAWARALPLWAATRWLWITVASAGGLRCWTGGESAGSGEGMALADLPLAPPYPLLVLDYGAADLPAGWWFHLAALLAAGGVLFACGLHRDGLGAAIRAEAAALRPGAWHVLEPSIDGVWRLRPDQAAIRQLLNADLQPPDSVRDWLNQVQRRWRPATGQVGCLPVWCDEARP